ncbi:flavodoxin family protein isoform X2 [Wolffia australiana]
MLYLDLVTLPTKTKKLDRRLLNIGGKPLVQRGLGDDQHRSGYEGAFDPWLSSLWNALHEKDPILLPRRVYDMDASTQSLDSPKFEVIFHTNSETISNGSSAFSDFNCDMDLIGRVRSMSLGKSHHKRPEYLLQMVKNQRLTAADADADVRHIEFECDNDLHYQVGDILEVLPAQDPDTVEAFIRRSNLDPDSYITVLPRDSGTDHDPTAVASVAPVKLRAFVQLAMDVTSACPSRYFFEVMSFFAGAEHEKERLQYFASPEGRDDLYQYNQKERRTILEVLEDFPSVQLPLEWLIQLSPPLKTRPFSIASSPRAHPRQVHLTVKALTWSTPFKRKRFGLCSTWLTRLDPDHRVQVPAWIHSGSLPLPPPTAPLILVGPGTGCAPFRGFVEERAAQKSGPPVLFFFGCRNKEKDFLYRDFWMRQTESGGVLAESGGGGGFLAAFSRDQPRKVYVQDKMREERERVWRMLRSGAHVYIAGSASKMPADVLTALEEIVAAEIHADMAAASRWLRRDQGGKIFIEAWS